MSTASAPTTSSRRRGADGTWTFLRSREGVVGLVLLVLVLGVALLGPLLAPHPIDTPLGVPGAGPSADAPFGLDFLGRDVLSRILHGGLPVIGVAVAAVAIAYVVGVTIGLSAGLSRSVLDPILMRSVDVMLVFPAMILLLVLLAGAGSSPVVLILGIVLVLFPGISRLVRTAALEVSTTEYVEAAVGRGESRVSVMCREVLPNIAPAVLADLGVRFGAAVIVAASVSFLGLGAKPPAANWGLMVAENRTVLPTNPWAVVVPAVLLALLTIAVNLLGDAFINSRERRSR